MAQLFYDISANDERGYVYKYLMSGNYSKLLKEDKKKKVKDKLSKTMDKLSKTKEKLERKSLKSQKKIHETLFDKTANAIAQIHLDSWNESATLRAEEKNATTLAIGLAGIENQKYIDIDEEISKISAKTNDYVEVCKKLEPNSTIKVEDVIKTIKTKGEDKFNDVKKDIQDKLKKLQLDKIKAIQGVDASALAAKKTAEIQAKIAEIPLTIEDKIQEIRDKLDGILGKLLAPAMNPDLSDFDLDTLIGMIKGLTDPLIAGIAPLEGVGGSIPIIGDIAGILSLLTSASGGKKLTKEEIKKIIGDKKPSIPEGLDKNIDSITDDIREVASKLPTMLISVIFAMINVIYSKLKIITSVIPLGSFFPLTLIDTAIAAPPLIWDFASKVPALLKAALMGVIKDKLAEAMALACPDCSAIGLPAISELQDPQAEQPSAKSAPKEIKKSYAEYAKKYVKDKKESAKSDNKYLAKNNQITPPSMVDVGKVLKSYKKIYNGSKKTINKYVVTIKKENNVETPVITKTPITRYKGTPEDFYQKLRYMPICNRIDQRSTMTYDKIIEVRSLVGADEYEIYQKYIKEKEPEEFLIIQVTEEI